MRSVVRRINGKKSRCETTTSMIYYSSPSMSLLDYHIKIVSGECQPFILVYTLRMKTICIVKRRVVGEAGGNVLACERIKMIEAV